MKCLRSKKRKSALLITTRVVEKRRLRKLTCGRWALAVGAVRLGPEALPRPAPALPLHSAVTVALYICSLINICMYVYTQIYVYAYTHPQIKYMYVCIHTHTRTHTHTHTHTRTQVYTYIYIYMCVCVCVCVCVYVCVCVCACVCTRIYKYNNV
jgi:hypothetical protein